MIASNAFDKWLNKDLWLSAHTLLHTFSGRLRASGCPLVLIDQIGGWSSFGTVGAKYGQGYGIRHIVEAVTAISLSMTSNHPDCLPLSKGYE